MDIESSDSIQNGLNSRMYTAYVGIELTWLLWLFRLSPTGVDRNQVKRGPEQHSPFTIKTVQPTTIEMSAGLADVSSGTHS